MKLGWLGHSAFYLQTLSGKRLVFDPYYPYIGMEMPKVSADIVTVSHAHRDHCNASCVGGKPTVLKKAGNYDIDGVRIDMLSSYHDERHGELRGENLITVVEADGMRLCHMGDIGQPATEFDFSILKNVDALLIPVGGTYTINAKEALAYCENISPRIIVPMHYHTPGCKIDISTASEFLKNIKGDILHISGLADISSDLRNFHGTLVFDEKGF